MNVTTVTYENHNLAILLLELYNAVHRASSLRRTRVDPTTKPPKAPELGYSDFIQY